MAIFWSLLVLWKYFRLFWDKFDWETDDWSLYKSLWFFWVLGNSTIEQFSLTQSRVASLSLFEIMLKIEHSFLLSFGSMVLWACEVLLLLPKYYGTMSFLLWLFGWLVRNDELLPVFFSLKQLYYSLSLALFFLSAIISSNLLTLFIRWNRITLASASSLTSD